MNKKFAKSDTLVSMQESYPKLSGDVAGDRRHDVYMGIDVFGRNTFGGGQWNVCLPDHSLSIYDVNQ